jgi:hypothetical protein
MSAKWTAIHALANEIGVSVRDYTNSWGDKKGSVVNGGSRIVNRVEALEDKFDMLFAYLKIELEGTKCTEPKIVKAKKKGKTVNASTDFRNYFLGY